jgi:hypothetical protein
VYDPASSHDALEAAMSHERVLESKLVNALVPDAEADESISLPYVDKSTWAILRWFKRYHKGLWVGGAAKLTETQLVFEPNAMNRAAHSTDTSFSFPLAAISQVAVEPGFITKIIAMHTPDRVYRIRCFGAAAFADSIRRQAAAASAENA